MLILPLELCVYIYMFDSWLSFNFRVTCAALVVELLGILFTGGVTGHWSAPVDTAFVNNGLGRLYSLAVMS